MSPGEAGSVPSERPAGDAAGLPVRSRGVIGLLEENCTVCMLCARECPDWCIYIDSHKEPVPQPPGRGRPRVRNVLDRFAIDFSLCMYCGICIEACPYDALFWSPEFSYAETDIGDLTHERDRLREWMGVDGKILRGTRDGEPGFADGYDVADGQFPGRFSRVAEPLPGDCTCLFL